MSRSEALIVRASEMDRALLCPASVRPDPNELRVLQPSGEAAAVGTAVHTIMEQIVKGDLDYVPSVEAVCVENGIEGKETDVRVLCWRGLEILKELRPFISAKSRTEVRMEEEIVPGILALTGRADVLECGVDEATGLRTVVVVDWKSGMKTEEDRHAAQMRSYSALGLTEYPDAQVVKVVLAWLQEGERTVLTYSAGDIAEWEYALPNALDWDGRTYTAGEHCRYCGRLSACSGRARWLEVGRSTVLDNTWLSDAKKADSDRLGEAIMQARILRDACDSFLSAAKIHVEYAGGAIALSDGGRIVVVERKGAMRLDAPKVLPVLRERFGCTQEQIDGMVTISKDALVTAVQAETPRGEKKKVSDALLADLEAKGAARRLGSISWVEVRRPSLKGVPEVEAVKEGGSE